MHFHLPKPLHGWREFVGEVGIIVVGVLIALGAEQAVETYHWQTKVSEARTQLRHEVGNDLALFDDRISQQQCVTRRINELAVIVTEASATGHLPPLGPISGPGSYTYPTSVWESHIAAETMTHFPAEQTAAISRAYRFIGLARESSREEEQAWLMLKTMVGPGRPIDPASISRLVEALEVARAKNFELKFLKETIFRVLVKGGLGSDFPEVDPRNPPIIGKGKQLICEAIGKPPETY